MTAQFKQILRKTVADCGHFFLSDCWMSKVQAVYFPFFFLLFLRKKNIHLLKLKISKCNLDDLLKIYTLKNDIIDYPSS